MTFISPKLPSETRASWSFKVTLLCGLVNTTIKTKDCYDQVYKFSKGFSAYNICIQSSTSNFTIEWEKNDIRKKYIINKIFHHYKRTLDDERKDRLILEKKLDNNERNLLTFKTVSFILAHVWPSKFSVRLGIDVRLSWNPLFNKSMLLV